MSHARHLLRFRALLCIAMFMAAGCFRSDAAEAAAVESQPLAANARRIVEALEVLGQPLDAATRANLRDAGGDTAKLQAALDARAFFIVTVNPGSQAAVARGVGNAEIQQGGWTALLVKVLNPAGVAGTLRVASPQAGPVYSGSSKLSAERMQRPADDGTANAPAEVARFLGVELFQGRPMRGTLSGLECEYVLLLVSSRDAGRRDAAIAFEIAAAPASRGELTVTFDVRPAVGVKLNIRDHDGNPTTARLTFRDATGHVFPAQAKRLAPDFFFQEHIYRRDGETVSLPPGKLSVEFTRGPEYAVERREFTVTGGATLDVKLRRWIEPERFGFFSGDHHIHGAGCAHYTSPTEGVTPENMLRQCEGEALNVGHVLTWGPCFDYQRKFFLPRPHDISGPRTILKYDLEISGFGSDNFGHVCLLNLRDQTYPGSDGTKTKGWPKWTTPVLRWAKAQGAVTGFAHSASGLGINSATAARRIFLGHDANRDARLTAAESAEALLPELFEKADADLDGTVSEEELVASHERAADMLPNLAVPEMNGVGAMEAPVAVAHGVCDFISAMDTPRIAEWNMWYHLLNCGFPLKVSGETDFPCMSGTRVGQGRVYAKLERLEFAAWCEALRLGRSYVSDGYAHAPDFRVNDIAPGFGDVQLDSPRKVRVGAKVAFAAEQPDAVAHGRQPPGGVRWTGDTVLMHGPPETRTTKGGTRRVELIVNGKAVAERNIPADGAIHDLSFDAEISRSSWVALRHFPQMHTNPVNVIVAGKPIRVSKTSARWCIEAIAQLWRQRARILPPAEYPAAEKAFDEAKQRFREIASESP
jgi:hypothetical protein